MWAERDDAEDTADYGGGISSGDPFTAAGNSHSSKKEPAARPPLGLL
jgi:hypothetical protein